MFNRTNADHRGTQGSSSSSATWPMIARLDDISRKTLTRFSLKLCFGIFFAAVGKGPFLLVASVWFSIYAFLTIIVGVLLRERMLKRSFNHWDEALWLTACALTVKALH
jgi:hypothetical protein